MTQEHKELLLKDLCARLPYGVKFMFNKNIYTTKGLDLIVTDEGDWEYAVTAKDIAPIEIDFVKPYLLPFLSITYEQKQEYQHITERWMYDSSYSIGDSIDFLNKNHFDYRGLIERGLAIDATNLHIY